MTYRIKPLEWDTILPDWWSADTILGSLVVREQTYHLGMRYHFDFFDDEDDEPQPCSSMEDGRSQAEAYYRSRLLEALEEVTT